MTRCRWPRQVVALSKENTSIPLKLRVFVKASLEAKALSDYFAQNPDQVGPSLAESSLHASRDIPYFDGLVPLISIHRSAYSFF